MVGLDGVGDGYLVGLGFNCGVFVGIVVGVVGFGC